MSVVNKVATEKLPRHVYAKVEGILYNYKTFDSQIRINEAELEAMMPSLSTSIVTMMGKSGTRPDSQQEKWVLQLEDRKALQIRKKVLRLRAQKRAVDDALQYMGDREKQIFDLKYMRELSHKEVFEHMNLLDRTYRRSKDELIKKFATFLGLL